MPIFAFSAVFVVLQIFTNRKTAARRHVVGNRTGVVPRPCEHRAVTCLYDNLRDKDRTAVVGRPQGVMPSTLHLPRSFYDFSVCDFPYDTLDIVGDHGLRFRRCLQFIRASYDFLFWLSSMF